MSGNVFEWCLDRSDAKYYGRSSNVGPAKTKAAAYRMIRGGNLICPESLVRPVYGARHRPGWGDFFLIGFRVCLAPQIEGR